MTTSTSVRFGRLCRGWLVRQLILTHQLGQRVETTRLEYLQCERTGWECFWPPLMEPGVLIANGTRGGSYPSAWNKYYWGSES